MHSMDLIENFFINIIFKGKVQCPDFSIFLSGLYDHVHIWKYKPTNYISRTISPIELILCSKQVEIISLYTTYADTVSMEFVLKILDKFGFGQFFIDWIATLYNGI